MKLSEIKNQALASYPPTSEMMRALGSSIGTGQDISEALCMSHNGPRTWRSWVSGETQIPRAYWVLLVCAHYEAGGISIELDIVPKKHCKIRYHDHELAMVRAQFSRVGLN
jgi:hypothetical protein